MSSARDRLEELQKSLYDKAVDKAKFFAAAGSPTILNYAEKYFSSLPTTFKKTSSDHLLQKIKQQKFVLYGDFHTLKQSQRGLLRLLKSFKDKYPAQKIILALEMFRASDQKYLNRYVDGEISEQELLAACEYRKTWGFPWENYRMLIEFAIESNYKIMGINTKQGGKEPLEKRDEFASQLLVKTANRHSDAIIICLIGEYHLADEHLPAYLEDRSPDLGNKIMRIFTNVDRYYFQTQGHHSGVSSEFLSLGSNKYCILNSPPWIKWQSYTLWEEMRSVKASEEYDWDQYEDSIELYTEEFFDIDSHILSLVGELAAFLKLPLGKSEASKFNVYFFPEQNDFDELQDRYDIPNQEMASIVERLSIDGFYFFGRGLTFIIADLSLNNLAFAAGQFLHALFSAKPIDRNTAEGRFVSRILDFASGSIAAKILNPRRKGRNLDYYAELVRVNSRRRLIGHAKMLREAARAVLDFHAWMEAGGSRNRDVLRPPRQIVLTDESSYYEVSKSIGAIIGNSLYRQTMIQAETPELMRDIFRKPPARAAKAFRDWYARIVLR
jgi:uncharacterized iron-regulated protein